MRLLVAFRLLLCLSFSASVRCQEETKGQEETKEKDTADEEEDGAALLTDDHLRQVHTEELDPNKDKEATKEELLNFMEKHYKDVSLSGIDLKEALDEKDTSHDGFVSLQEHLVDALEGATESLSRGDITQAAYDSRKEDETEKFTAADENSDGLLNITEMAAIEAPETHEGAMKVAIKEHMKTADADGNGVLTRDEFEKIDAEQYTKSGHEKLFKRLDVNGDGHIDTEEMRPLNNGRIAREELVDEFVHTLDKDGDEKVDSNELVKARLAVNDSDLQDFLLSWAKKRQILGR